MNVLTLDNRKEMIEQKKPGYGEGRILTVPLYNEKILYVSYLRDYVKVKDQRM